MKTLKTVVVGLLGIGILTLLSAAVFGQVFTLDPELKWQVLESAHFRVIFHEGLENMAGETLVLAEEAFTFWTKELQYIPKGKTTILVADVGDVAAGGANPVTNEIFISTAWARVFNEWLNSRTRSWLEELVFHEYGHIIDIGKVSGISQLLRPLTRIIMPNIARPRSVIEGIPTYYESKLRGHSRATDPRDAMYLRAMVLTHRFPSFSQAATLYSRSEWPSTYMLSHDLGPWLIRYLAEQYGSDKIAKLAEINAQRPLNLLAIFGLGDDFNSVLKETLGVSTRDFYDGFQAWLKEQFASQIEAIEREGVTESRKLNPLKYWNYDPTWSPDGRFIAYYHADPVEGMPTRLPSIRLIQAGGTKDQALVQDTWPLTFFRPPFWASAPAWSPDGKKLIYAKVERYRNYYLYGDLYLYDLEAKKEQRLTHGARVYNPIFFPDGKRILFAKHNWGEKSPDLAVFDLKTRTISTLKEFPNDMLLDSFEVSPDGKQIALSLWRWGGHQDIYLLSVEGAGDLQPLTQDQATDLDPTWSPNGQFVLFSSDRDGVNNLYAYSLSEQKLLRVTNFLTGGFTPAVSPDGKQIAFVGYSVDGYEIHTMEFNPEIWKPTDYQKEQIPEWPGFRKPHFPVTLQALDPRSTLAPKIVLPLIIPSKEGLEALLTVVGIDPFFGQTYSLTAVYSFSTMKLLSYSLLYTNQQLKAPFWLLPLSLSMSWFQVDPLTFSRRIKLAIPLMKQLNWNIQLSLGYQQMAGLELKLEPWMRELLDVASRTPVEFLRGLTSLILPSRIENGFTVEWSCAGAYNISPGLFSRASLNLEVGLGLERRRGQWPMTFFLEFLNSLRLPGVDDPELAARVVLALSDGPLILGGTVGSLTAFPLRGFTREVFQGQQIGVETVSLEYRFLIWPVEQGVGDWPIFLDDLRASIFIDAGAAAKPKEFQPAPTERPAVVKVGLGAELHLGIYLGYALGPLTLRVGVAQGIGEAKPQVYFGFGTAF